MENLSQHWQKLVLYKLSSSMTSKNATRNKNQAINAVPIYRDSLINSR